MSDLLCPDLQFNTPVFGEKLFGIKGPINSTGTHFSTKNIFERLNQII